MVVVEVVIGEAVEVEVVPVVVVVGVEDVDEPAALAAMSMFFTAERLMTLEPTFKVGPLEPFVTPVTTPVISVPLVSTPVTVFPKSEAASLI